MPWASKYVPFIGTRWTCSKFGPWLIVCLENGIGASPVCWQASALLREPAPSPSASRVRHSLCGRMQRASLQASPQATTIGTLSPLTHSPRLVTAVICRACCARSSTLVGHFLGKRDWRLSRMLQASFLREPAPSPLASHLMAKCERYLRRRRIQQAAAGLGSGLG